MQLLQACTFDFVVPHNIVGHIIAFSNVVHAFDDSSHQSHMLHQVCVYVCVRTHAGTLNDFVCLNCRLPLVKHMVPRLACIANQLKNLHRADRVLQAVHQDVVLVSSEEEWELAERHNAVRMDNSLEKSM